jgi:hypothetical protein
MSKIVTITIVCGCKEKKKVMHPVELEDAQNGSAVESLQIECPFQYVKNCIKHLSIQLPPGMKPVNDGSLLRG